MSSKACSTRGKSSPVVASFSASRVSMCLGAELEAQRIGAGQERFADPRAHATIPYHNITVLCQMGRAIAQPPAREWARSLTGPPTGAGSVLRYVGHGGALLRRGFEGRLDHILDPLGP